MLLAALVAGVVVVAGAGTAAYFASRAVNAATAGRPLIPHDHVIAQLAERGFECTDSDDEFSESSGSSECTHTTGRVTYSFEVAYSNDWAQSFSVSLTAEGDLYLSPINEGFLTWLALVPFADDPEAAEAARGWLSEHLGLASDPVAAAIRGITYELTQKAGSLLLSVHTRGLR